MKVELTRLRILPGKSARVDEWLRTINDRVQEAVHTLDREKMKIEVIFRENIRSCKSVEKIGATRVGVRERNGVEMLVYAVCGPVGQ